MRKECPLCRNQKFKVLYTLSSSTFSKIKDFYMVECKKCGLIFIKNPPTSEELEHMYSKEYFTNVYGVKDLKHFDCKPAKFRFPLYNEDLSKIEVYTNKGKIVDIGSSVGTFLRVARKRGWEAIGIDPSVFDAAYCKKEHGLRIVNKSIEIVDFPKESFDAINMNNVLEHLHNPLKILTKIRKWLKKDGVLLVQIPNERGLVYSCVRIYKRARYIFGLKNNERLLQHLFYFDLKTTRTLLNKAGFDVLEIYTRRTYPTKEINLILGIIQRAILTVSRFLKCGGDLIIVFARKSEA